MPHPKYLLHCSKQKRDNISTVKMLHQMSVWVVVVALGLVLTQKNIGFILVVFLRKRIQEQEKKKKHFRHEMIAN